MACALLVGRANLRTPSHAGSPNTKAWVSLVDVSNLALQLFDDPRPDVGNDGPQRSPRRAEQHAATACARQTAGSRQKGAGRQSVGDNRQPAQRNALR